MSFAVAEVQSPAIQTLKLKVGEHEISLDSRGGSMSSWQYSGLELLRVPDGLGNRYTGRGSASYNVHGYFGRIPEGSISFEGKQYPVPPTPPEEELVNWETRLHGFGPHTVWEVLKSNESSVCFQTPKNFLPHDYPFPYVGSAEYKLSSDCLEISLGITALKRGPYSVTWHPFFNRYLGESSTHIAATFAATGILSGGTVPLPKHGPTPIPPHLNFSMSNKEVLVPHDSSYVGWDGEKAGIKLQWATIKNSNAIATAPESLTLELHANTSVLHIYTGKDGFVCIEPSLAAANGPWLVDKGLLDPRYGGVVLDAGETVTMKITNKLF